LCPLGEHIYEREGGDGLRSETWNLYGEQAREVDFAHGEDVEEQEEEYRDGFSGYEPPEEEELTAERRAELEELAIPEMTWFNLQEGNEDERAVYEAAHPWQDALTQRLDQALGYSEMTQEMRDDFERDVRARNGEDHGVTVYLENDVFEIGWSQGEVLVIMNGEEVYDSYAAENEVHQVDWDSEAGEERHDNTVDVGETWVRLDVDHYPNLVNTFDESVRVVLFEEIYEHRDTHGEGDEEFSYSICSALEENNVAVELMYGTVSGQYCLSTVCVRAIVHELRRNPEEFHYEIQMGVWTFRVQNNVDATVLVEGPVCDGFVRIGDYVFDTDLEGMFRIEAIHRNVWY